MTQTYTTININEVITRFVEAQEASRSPNTITLKELFTQKQYSYINEESLKQLLINNLSNRDYNKLLGSYLSKKVYNLQQYYIKKYGNA